MRIDALLLATVLLTAGLAGCLGSDGEEAETASADGDVGATETETNETANETEPEDPGPRPEVHWYNGSAQGGSIGVTTYCAPGCDNGFTFPVENGSTAIVAEMTWANGSALDLYVYPPCDGTIFLTADCPERGEDTDGEDPARLEIVDDRAGIEGEWSVQVFPQDSYTEATPYTAAVSVFYGEQPPSGFTKLDGGP